MRDRGTFLPSLYSFAIRLITAASCARRDPVVPDKYFLGTRLFLSFGTRFLFATSSSLYIIVLGVSTPHK